MKATLHLFRTSLEECLQWSGHLTADTPSLLSKGELRHALETKGSRGWKDLILSPHSVVNVLRSSNLMAPAFNVMPRPLVESVSAYGYSNEGISESRLSFDTFIIARRRLIIERNSMVVSNELIEQELRREHAILITHWNETLSDGSGSVESRGFLDFHNVPPWDTWIGILQPDVTQKRFDSLLSWVPHWAEELINDAIINVPERCLEWLEKQ